MLEGEQVVKKGLAGCSNYAIKWFEEASEYLEKDIYAEGINQKPYC